VNHSVKTEGHLYQAVTRKAVTGEPPTMQSSTQQYVKLQEQLRDQERVENCLEVYRRSLSDVMMEGYTFCHIQRAKMYMAVVFFIFFSKSTCEFSNVGYTSKTSTVIE
jgi:hypothetical protein